MSKYLQVFKVSLSQELAYKANFLMWRVRNILQIFLVFFLWDTIFSDPNRQLFGYDRTKILTYVFGLLLIRAFVLSAKATEVGGEIARGDLSNYLLRPLNYFKYWLTRDLSTKTLNLVFAAAEALVLFYLFKPPFFLQTNPVTLLAFVIALAFAMLLFFVTLFITGSIPFWAPELAWGSQFILMVVVLETLSGALFPLDILPNTILSVLNFTPFPYLIFFPLQVYLGQVAGIELIKGLLISGAWLVILWFILNSIWQKGLKVYQSHGR